MIRTLWNHASSSSCIRSVVLAVTITTGCILYGSLLRYTSLHNGNECEMTWSSIRFILLPDPQHTRNSSRYHDHQQFNQQQYKLLKFTDARDKRFDHIVDYKRPYQEYDRTTYHVKENLNWCKPRNKSGKPGRAVIYVPGHEGTYMQARSLGAHGTTLTRHGKDVSREALNDLLRRLEDGSMNAYAESVSDFLFDVYAVDFGGEGGGIHGSRLFAQANFLVSVLERIADECHDGEQEDKIVEGYEIVIVAHSIGGLVARKAALMVNQQKHDESDGQRKPWVRNIITLASPHGGIPFIFDSSVYRFQRYVQEQEWLRNRSSHTFNIGGITYNIVSISGGLRDELIPPSSCRIDGNNTISVLAADIVNPPSKNDGNHDSPNRFGMDHNAIVWCHGVLSFVREAIHAAEYEKILKLVQEKQSVVDAHGDGCNFDCQNTEKQQLLQQEYGLLKALAIMTSMLYNAQLLLVLYVINAILHYLVLICWRRYNFEATNKVVSCAYFFVPILSSLVASMAGVGKRYIGFGSVVILAFNAMNIYYMIFYGIFLCLSISVRTLQSKTNQNTNGRSSYKIESTAVCSSGSSRHELSSKLSSWKCIVVVADHIQIQAFYAIQLIIASLAVLCICSMVFKDVVIVNVLSAGAMTFIAFVVSTMFYIVRVVFATRTDPKLQGITRSIASTLLLLFPISSVGKIMFALSLLTRYGQTKAIPYMDFERLQWESFCNSKICEVVSFLKYDLSRYAVLISVPIHFFCAKRFHRQECAKENHDIYTKTD